MNEIYETIGKIEEVKSAQKGNGDEFRKIIIGGKTYNVFDSKLFDVLQLGKNVKVKYNKNVSGEFTYKNVFFVEETNETQPTITKQFNKTEKKPDVDWDAKDRKIVRQNVLNRAVDMFINDKIKKEEILTNAENFEKWVYGELDLPKEKPKNEKIVNVEEIDMA